MATVDVSFTPLTAHVRTARLVALAVARRAGVPEEMLDEVRLAVGEACSRAVGVHLARGADMPVAMRLFDDRTSFAVEVTDIGSLDDGADLLGGFDLAEVSDGSDGDGVDTLPASFGLAVISGLVEDFTVISEDGTTRVKMVWPAQPRPLPASD